MGIFRAGKVRRRRGVVGNRLRDNAFFIGSWLRQFFRSRFSRVGGSDDFVGCGSNGLLIKRGLGGKLHPEKIKLNAVL